LTVHLKLNTQISVIIRGYHTAMVFFGPQSQRDLAIRQGQVNLNPYAQISETIRGNLIAKVIFRHPLLHKLEFATPTSCAWPKSITFTLPSGVTNTFPGLKSECTTCRAWA
jgi:hypothetical protein